MPDLDALSGREKPTLTQTRAYWAFVRDLDGLLPHGSLRVFVDPHEASCSHPSSPDSSSSRSANPTTWRCSTPSSNPGSATCLPGRRPGKPRSVAGLNRLLNQHGFPVTSARNTAMIEAVAELPPTIISDLFGVHSKTAHAWANYAQDSWADYLAARATPPHH
ncbi:hypothetical protein [Saccharothrix syringae]|uniref:Uncharacterized protein n=1 Tax=Saccharothrix syringae TaxID=103733 RepID=A0A5Q0H3I8_SACSY|nr:hypothetical protein [Saccharothrix syringae]QFZ20485.1 hypothetical protein EKG83_26500 [Saccharothrix syringae]